MYTLEDMEAIRVAVTLKFGPPVIKHACNFCDKLPLCCRLPNGWYQTSDDICTDYLPKWYNKKKAAKAE